ncbi:asparagine synthase-related protein [Xanthomonas perforans]
MDQQVFQLAWQIPLKLKMVRGEQKYILKRRRPPALSSGRV